MGDLIDKVLDIEQDMFINVKASNDSPCQNLCRENPSAFRGIRRAQFETWSEETLESYYNDLLGAVNDGDNLMIIKYAKMDRNFTDDHIFPPKFNDSNKDVIIGKIVEIEKEWRENNKYKHLLRKSDSGMRYMRGELKTYSIKTLGLYHKNQLQAKKDGRNLVEETYSNMFKVIEAEQ